MRRSLKFAAHGFELLWQTAVERRTSHEMNGERKKLLRERGESDEIKITSHICKVNNVIRCSDGRMPVNVRTMAAIAEQKRWQTLVSQLHFFFIRRNGCRFVFNEFSNSTIVFLFHFNFVTNARADNN